MCKVWIDVETGGLDSKANPILQIALLIEDSEGNIVNTYNSYIKPPEKLIIEDAALKVNGITYDIINSAPIEKDVISDIVKLLKGNNEQYEFCGYNSRFDMDFVVAMFKRSVFQYWTYFNYYDVDVFALVKILGISGERYDEKKKKVVPCKKLECLCEKFGIKLKAHDALNDIKATRKLYKKLVKGYLK